jgi:hypothetical protein
VAYWFSSPPTKRAGIGPKAGLAPHTPRLGA